MHCIEPDWSVGQISRMDINPNLSFSEGTSKLFTQQEVATATLKSVLKLLEIMLAYDSLRAGTPKYQQNVWQLQIIVANVM